jgi:hypothetical protein
MILWRKKIMSKKMTNPMKVITGVDTRWSYANVWEPKSINGGAPKYSVSLIIPKSDTKTIAKIKAAIEAAYTRARQSSRATASPSLPLSVLKTPLRDGDAERPDDEAYKNAYFINANATTAPGIVDADLNPDPDPLRGLLRRVRSAPASPSMPSTLPVTRASPAGSTTCRSSATVSLSAARQVLSPTSPPMTTKIS